MTAVLEAPPATATFDARPFALAWRSVVLACGKDKDRPVLDRTVCVELDPEGVRLIATDGFMLLHAYVPVAGYSPEGGDSVVPGEERITVVARDPYGRAIGLAAHLLNLTQGDDPMPLEVVLRLEADAGTQESFEGLEPQFVSIEVPDQERLLLPTFEADYPDWRVVIDRFEPHTTDAIGLSSDVIARLSKLAQVNADRPIVWHFGGANAMALLEVQGTEPAVMGAVMPVRQFDPPAPMETTEGKDDDVSQESITK